MPSCSSCGHESLEKELQRCCGDNYYCDNGCQKSHWKHHKAQCERKKPKKKKATVETDSPLPVCSICHGDLFYPVDWPLCGHPLCFFCFELYAIKDNLEVRDVDISKSLCTVSMKTQKTCPVCRSIPLGIQHIIQPPTWSREQRSMYKKLAQHEGMQLTTLETCPHENCDLPLSVDNPMQHLVECKARSFPCTFCKAPISLSQHLKVKDAVLAHTVLEHLQKECKHPRRCDQCDKLVPMCQLAVHLKDCKSHQQIFLEAASKLTRLLQKSQTILFPCPHSEELLALMTSLSTKLDAFSAEH
jgi:hypothetical protein